ncbi:wax ester/triacylglycerol synthase family O-acyltransferase [Rubrivivax gelatinosus]|uniref:wax ester/triacylglycerol synthase family O-acyltransferase n=1 Tax=Rubrivivax gelatinosus TaxID=28068 RepID=UPI0005C16DD0|nr:wax ester/triacylglycerol synthase family O-acyltransferase [Rubrivivax gelatinosus]MBG6080683.1 WS/DGAT/MGAT family acyltransferase [Rubrivivax gelatinosus]
MQALSGVDGAFLHLETTQTPMHVGSLHLFVRPPGARGDFATAVRRLMKQRLHLAPVLTRRLATMPLQFANPVWVEDGTVDLDWHVQRVAVPAPGTQAELEAAVARLHAERLDRERPLWRIWVLEGLASGEVGYYVQVHHALLDGKAGVLLAQTLFDPSPEPPPRPRGKARLAENPGTLALAATALARDAGLYVKLARQLPQALQLIGTLFGGPGKAPGGTGKANGHLRENLGFGPKTALNVPIGAERSFAAVSLPMDTLKALAAAHEAKLNDIVLALCSGMLRRWLAAHGGVPKKPLLASMPISLRASGDQEFTTKATLSLVNLHTDIANPLKRLLAIRDAAGAVKSVAKRARGVIPTDFPSLGAPWLLQGLASLYGASGLAGTLPPLANVVISNVPGPREPLYLAGARMTSYWPLSIVEHGIGLNITVMSYAGELGFGFTAAQAAVADAGELRAALLEALDELVAASRPKPPRKRTGTAARALPVS